MKNLFWILIGSLLMTMCKNEPKVQEKSVQAITSTQNADIIRQPQPGDTLNVAKISFAERNFNFGKVKEGEIVKHTFTFKNTGKVPLVIANAQSSCGCTVPEYPKEPIPVDGENKIEVVFKTEGKQGKQIKVVTVNANTFPYLNELVIEGEVLPK